LSTYWWVWLVGFVFAEILRYWAIATLGNRWNTRILVIDGLQPIRTGPYRFIAHPNYLAVALELVCIPMIFGAWVTAVVAGALNAMLLLGLRIPCEQRAVREAAGRHD
jgi:methyltransferase